MWIGTYEFHGGVLVGDVFQIHLVFGWSARSVLYVSVGLGRRGQAPRKSDSALTGRRRSPRARPNAQSPCTNHRGDF